MKVLTIVFLVLLAGSAWGQSQEIKKPVPPITDKAKGTNKSKNYSKPQQTVTVELPPTINVNVGGKLEVKSENDKAEGDNEGTNWAERLIALFTGLLVVVTGVLAGYTYLLWDSTAKASDRQAREMKDSLAIAQQSANAATKAAEAAIISSMPVLSPYIVEGAGVLHPFRSEGEAMYPSMAKPKSFESGVDFVFENFGKTPGIIREVRADLFICENDQFPTVEFEQLPIIDYQPIIASESRGNSASMGVAECRKQMTLTPIEFSELLAEAKAGQYRRFAFIGLVTYDDFFGFRHRRRFCVKLRRKYPDGDIFQLVRGGKAYNHVERQEIPKDE